MILQSLVQLAKNEKLIDDPDFEFKPVAWIVRLKADGTLAGIEDRRLDLNEGRLDKRGKPIKAKLIGKDVLVPLQGIRTSGDAEAFLVDKAEYVFGVDIAGKRSGEKLLNRLSLFYGAIEQFAVTTGNTDAATVVEFGRRLTKKTLDERAALLPKDVGAGDLFMFCVGAGSEPLQTQTAAKEYWKGLRKPGEESPTAGFRRCLVTGQLVNEASLFRKIKNVPGDASGGLSLVSFNSPAWESYGWEGGDNAPLCREAAEAAATALNRLLDPRPTDGVGASLPVRRIRLTEDTAVVFWSPEPVPEVQSVLDLIPDLMNPADDAADVGNLFNSPRSGAFKKLKTSAAFYAMTLTSMTGRVIVRDWLEGRVSEAQENLRAHFEALACVRNTPWANGRAPRGILNLTELMNSLAAPGRERKVPAALAADFIHAALRGTPYPRAILQRALLRERAEVTNDEWDGHVRRDARAALIKAVLTRDLEFKIYLEAHMNEQETDSGYWLGALLAVLEDTQRLASGGVNSSVKDKFYGAASATPAAVFPTMMSLYHKHVRKARDERLGAAVNREKRADAILNRIMTIPVHFDLKQQGLFVLGYHHQRYELRKKRDAISGDESKTTLEGAAE